MPLKKIVITGPESTGKSTLAKNLAQRFGVKHTLEQARMYLNGLDRPYEFEDLERIGALQLETEDHWSDGTHPLLFCDTDLITIKIWSEFKYGKVSERLLEWINSREYDLYLLCRPDVPWIPDPLRENPHNRDLLFDLHVEELNRLGKVFEIIEGNWDQRTANAIRIVTNYMKYWAD